MRSILLPLLLPVLLSAAPPTLTETTAVAGGLATRVVPSLTTDGMTLGRVRSFRARVCAAAGQTLSGTGTLEVYTMDGADGLWSNNPWLVKAMSSLTATACQGAACRCVLTTNYDASLLPANGFRLVVAPNVVGVSGGANVTVKITSCLVGVGGLGDC